MLHSIVNALLESRDAIRAADGSSSGCKLALDFLTSRLLKFRSMPGRDRLRASRIQGCNIHYRFNRGDIQSIREVMIENAYRFPIQFDGAKIALDLGANIGLWSLWAHREYNLQHIIALEPEPGNAELTRKNFESNGIPGAVIQAAVGGESGSAVFQQRKESNLGRIASSGINGSLNTIQVRLCSMLEILQQLPKDSTIDLVKIDIEGAEQAVFSADISWLDRVRALIIEWHSDRCDPAPMIAKIQAANFEHYAVNASRQDNLSLFFKK